MPSPKPTFRPLKKESGPEPFAIDAEDWNSMVQFFYEHNKLLCRTANDDGGIPHAWKLEMRWDAGLLKWVFKVAIPGFVRGHDLVATTTLYLAGEEARLRENAPYDPVVTDVRRVVVPLTQFPEIPISEDAWRTVVGPNTIIAESGDSRSVPPFIQEAYNILTPEKRKVDTENLTIASTNIDDTLEQDLDTACLLRSAELFVRMPRPSAVPVYSASEAGIEYIDLQLRYSDPVSDPPSVVILTEPPLQTEVVMNTTLKMVLDGNDPGYDLKHIATIWLIGPPGELFEGKVNELWTPLVQYHSYYSLDYTVNADMQKVPPLRQYNPAAGLISGTAVQALVEIINAYNREIEGLYQQVTVNGRFWEV